VGLITSLDLPLDVCRGNSGLRGADALKPDLRVAQALRKLGFRVPAGEHATLVVAHAAADEADITLLVLDQLLWGLTDSQEPGDSRA
jgi:hypothetical protein